MRTTAAATLALMLSGCASSEVVKLRNPNGETAECGPYTTWGNLPSATVTSQQRLRDCVEDYKEQGYRRI